ncbi:hypothetical protein B0H13DRAFT_2378526 [Mycena leptocephala]|nr:hypothetical protein B0H13DRAFT_2378526 [Mycena leptocephala]
MRTGVAASSYADTEGGRSADLGISLDTDALDVGMGMENPSECVVDPEGILYYNDLDSFTGNRVVKYKVYQVTVTDKHNNSTLLVHIKFYHQTEDTCHADSLALDPAGTVTAADMDGHTCGTGKWQDLDICYATGTTRKYDDDMMITVAVKSLNNSIATIEDKFIGFLQGKSVDVKGNFAFKDIGKLGDGICANWNNDRVVFYHDDVWSTDFTAYVRTSTRCRRGVYQPVLLDAID